MDVPETLHLFYLEEDPSCMANQASQAEPGSVDFGAAMLASILAFVLPVKNHKHKSHLGILQGILCVQSLKLQQRRLTEICCKSSSPRHDLLTLWTLSCMQTVVQKLASLCLYLSWACRRMACGYKGKMRSMTAAIVLSYCSLGTHP